MTLWKQRISLWLPVVLWCAGIFYLSHIPHLRITLYWWDYPLRKAAHMTEYAILARLVTRALRGSTTWSTGQIFIASLVFVVFYASSDEFHQHFVEGRHGSPIDVLIDLTGAWIGLGFKP